MATVTRAVFRQRISEAFEEYHSLTADSGTTTTIVDTELADLIGGGDDDAFLNWYVIVTSGNNDGEIRRISAYAQSTNTITVSRAFTNAIATHTYELYRFNPVDYHNALIRSIENLFPILYLPIRDETIIIDNHLLNPLFNTFSSGFTNWTEVGSPTVTQETIISIEGSSSAKVVSAGGAAGQLTQAPTINIPSIESKTVTFKCWVFATAASVARLRLDWDGSTFENGDFHTGADQWELITVSGTVPEGATQVKAICEVASGTKTAYFDFCWLNIEPIYDYTIPSNLLLGPYQVDIQTSENDPNSRFLPLIGLPIEGRRLRLIGKGLLSRPTTDVGTVEVTDAQAELIIAKAAHNLSRTLRNRAASQQRDRYAEDMRTWADEVDRLLDIPGHRSANLGVTVDLGINITQWHVEENSTDRILVLDHKRGSVDGIGFTSLI